MQTHTDERHTGQDVPGQAERLLAAVTDRTGYRVLDLLAARAYAGPLGSRILPRLSRWVRRRLPAAPPSAVAEPGDVGDVGDIGDIGDVGVPAAPAVHVRAAIEGYLDRPAPGQVSRGDSPLVISGWVAALDGPLSRVEVFIDGRSVGVARVGLPRPDLAALYPEPHAGLAGFELLCPATEFVAPEATVTVVATSWGGASLTLPSATIALAAADEALPTIDRAPTATATTAAARATATVRRERLRLLVFTHDLGYGGGQLWLSELLLKAQAQKSFPCTVVAPRNGPLAGVLRGAGIEVHLHGHLPVDDGDAYEARLTELTAWARSRGFTAVLANTFTSFPGADLGRRLGVPTVFAIHESWPPAVIWSVGYPPDWVHPHVRACAERALVEATAVVFEAEATRRQYLSHLRSEAAVVVRYGVDTAAIDRYCAEVTVTEARAGLGLGLDDEVLLVMGTIEPRKAQTVIAMAFAQLAGRHPRARLYLVGDQKTPYSQAIQEYAEATGLTDRITVVPVTAEIYAWYRAATLLICASDVESLPRSVLECMCFGVPVLATAVFGLPEILDDGVTGLLMAPMDLAATAGALERFLSMQLDERSAIATAAGVVAHRDHDSRDYAKAIVSMLSCAWAPA